ncbi:helix-turn-helix transcriptional regulator [Clostridium sp. YIM B02505]|uniref:Helix-turn-helix transcriptional regulator n=1 Tax=Clostridium yunnanense TaxID=2800325 RepID=A0ABS1ER26_9CLOT|nr:helix-turn-helix domain-containing protein [Clostridium yunnanense]MBK1811839.1 helix-turn-helix transcriptional regulator [Clostridium yunnanense]
MDKFIDRYGECPMYYTISVLEGKWKWIILWEIYRMEVVRYSKLKERLQTIAHKTLSQQLKELEADKIINRKQYNEVPPKVEYSLTERGKSLIPVLEIMSKWGAENMVKEVKM